MAIDPNPTNTTARDIITLALQDSGWTALGQSAPQEVINRALKRFNMILSFWATKRWFAWRSVDLAFTSTGAQSYTVGSGGDFNINSDFNADFNEDFGSGQPWGFRPVKVVAAYSRLLVSSPAQPVDYFLRQIMAKEDYAKIQLKSQANFPTHFFYDPVTPRGVIYFWPIPLVGQFEMHIIVPQPIVTIPSLDTILYIPPEYHIVLVLTLARWLRMAAKMPADPELNAMLRNATNGLKNNNAQLPNLQMPSGLVRPGIYNILSDEWH